jgi:hypothetical protein
MGVTEVTHALCGPCVTRSRVGTHQSGPKYPRDALFKGRNIQEFSIRDTSVGDTSTLHLTRGKKEYRTDKHRGVLLYCMDIRILRFSQLNYSDLLVVAKFNSKTCS